MKFIVFLLILSSFFYGCVCPQSVIDTVQSPIERNRIENELKGGRDAEYWGKVKNNCSDPFIIIDDSESSDKRMRGSR